MIINEQSKDYGYIYWIESWQVLCDGNIVDNNFADNSNITYTIENGSVKQIIINCYITTLSSVEYDYNLADGENLDDKVSSTKFAYAKPISYSIANYNAKFPIPTRDGFDFVAWTNGTTNVTNSTIWDKKYTKLTAIWQLQDIAVDNDNVKENIKVIFSPRKEQRKCVDKLKEYFDDMDAEQFIDMDDHDPTDSELYHFMA